MSHPRSPFVLCFAALIALPAPIDLVIHAAGWKLPGLAFRRTTPVLTAAGLWRGESGPELEAAIADQTFLAHGTGPYLNELAFRTLGRTPPHLRVRGDWIFLEDRMRRGTPEQWEGFARDASERIVEAAAPIRDAGLPLLVVLVPDRSRALREIAYPQGRIPEGRREFLESVTRALERRGIQALDLDEALRRPDGGREIFYRGDHHWTYEGARAGAEATAARLRSAWTSRLPRCDREPHRVTWTPDPTPPFSLLRMLAFRAESDLTRRFLGDPRAAAFEADAEVECEEGELVAMTTSYGLYGFAAFLANALRAPVTDLKGVGKGAFFAPTELVARVLNDPEARPPVAAVWEIPEYHLYELPSGAPSWTRFRSPAWRPDAGPRLEAWLEPVSGLSPKNGGFRVTSLRPRFRVRLAEPRSSIRIVLDSERVRSRGLLGLVGDTQRPLLLVDGRGPVGYDFTVDEPRTDFLLEMDLRSAGHTFAWGGVRGLREPSRSVR